MEMDAITKKQGAKTSLKRNLMYSTSVFLVFYFYIFSGFLTKIILGDEHTDSYLLLLILPLIVTIPIAVAFSFALIWVRNQLIKTPDVANYRPSKVFVICASVAILTSSSIGVYKSHSDVVQKEQAAIAKKQAEDKWAETVKLRQEKEKARFDALSPEQQAEELKLKEEQAKAAAEKAEMAIESKKEEEREAQMVKEGNERVAKRYAAINHSINECESNWSRLFRSKLRDPSYLEFDEEQVGFDIHEPPEESRIIIPYRAKNAFNGITIEKAECQINKDTYEVITVYTPRHGG